MNGDQAIETLREALRLSPENVPLRRHLAETLLAQGRPELAEAEFREALALAADDSGLKIGLANAFIQQGKHSLAAVLLEDLTRHPQAPARAFLLHARLLAHGGDIDEAIKQYRLGVAADPAAADYEFAERLGIADEADEESDGEDEDDDDETTDAVVEGRIRASWAEPGFATEAEVERPALKFADVGGMEALKDEIRLKIIHPLAHPELYRAYGKSTGGGILLYGPPGCGKTYLARATAGEIASGFLAVGINDVLEMWIGNSERNLHALFEQARANAPCVLFFDEVDALAASRADLKASGGRQLINQFLSELDGMGGQNEGVLVLAATNAPWHLDPAFRRPGRFDRILFVPPPDAPRAGLHPAAALPRQAHARRRLRPPGQEDREPLRRRPPRRRRPGRRGQAPRGPQGGRPQTPRHQGPAHRRRGGQAVDPRVVRHGPQLCPLLQPGRDLRRRLQIHETRMSTAFQRGIVLLQQGRFDLADREFRLELAQAPDDPQAHAFLSLCLAQRDNDEEALREADEATRLGPDFAFAHYVRGNALRALNRPREADAAAREAIRLDPSDADNYALLASIELDRRRWTEALAAADQGLALDPEHAGCRNLRAMALVQLGRKSEAERALGSALAADPQNPLTHANQGWTLLHRGDHVKAAEHFHEALRLDPELEWARIGIVEALKARSPIYRVMLGFFLWMGRQSRRAQWVVILGIIFGRQVLATLADANPRLAPLIVPILILSFAFLLLTWIASPLFNSILRLNRFGRLALSHQQRVESNWIGGCFLLAAAMFAWYLAGGDLLALVLMGYFGLLLLPLSVTFQLPPGRPRLLGATYTAGLAAVGATFFLNAALGDASP